MTASDPADPDPSSAPRASGQVVVLRPRTSRLAITAFVLGLAGVCPPLGFFAMTMGLWAYLRIVQSRGLLGGRGFALWALGLGAATTIIWIEVWDRSGQWMLGVWEARMETEIREVFSAALAGDAGAIRGTLGLKPDEHQDGIELFISEVQAGGLEPWAISITRFQQTESSFSRPVVAADIRIDVDQSIWTGVGRFVLEPPTRLNFDELDSFVAHPMLQGFKLIGPEGRALRLPEPPATLESVEEDVETVEARSPVAPQSGE